MPESDRGDLLADAVRAYNEQDRLGIQAARQIPPRGASRARERPSGMSALPMARRGTRTNIKVQTTTSRTPKEIHELGLC